MTYVWYLLALTLTTLSFLTFSKSKRMWVRIWDFPRLQLLVLLGISIVGLIWCEKRIDTVGWIVIVSAFVAILVHTLWILPYTPLFRAQVRKVPETDGSISILSANVLQTNTRHDDFVQMVLDHDPDILIMLESNKKWEESFEQRTHYPYSIKRPQENLYGMHLYSKHRIVHGDIRYLVEDEIPSIFASIQIHGSVIRFVVVHPTPPSPTQNDSSLPRDVELLIVADHLKDNQSPTIVCGDLNDVAWAHTTRLFRRYSKLLDPRIGRGFYNTYHASVPFFRWPLDHVFISNHFLLNDLLTLPSFGSDHFPILARLALKKNDKTTDITITSEEKEEVVETIGELKNL